MAVLLSLVPPASEVNPPVVASPVVVGATFTPGGGLGRARKVFGPATPPVVVIIPSVRVGPPLRSTSGSWSTVELFSRSVRSSCTVCHLFPVGYRSSSVGAPVPGPVNGAD